MNSSGITIAGCMLVDIINLLDKYPEKNMLANVLSTKHAVGGCVNNTIIDIAKIDSDITLNAVGRLGNDKNGEFVINQLAKHGVNTKDIKIDNKNPTANTIVMTDSKTGERTFFYTSGATAHFDIDDIDIDALDCDIFHIGYILLLDKLDEADATYGTRLAKLLDMVSQKGIKTSIDVVSEDSDRFAEKIIPALKYTDYAILNEIESCRVSGLDPYNADGSVNIANIKKTMELFIKHGVRERVIVHCCDGGFMLDKDGNFYKAGSYILPANYIKGSVGAGDAYAAACLYGIYNEYDPEYILDFAAAAAALSLSEEDSISGMKNKKEVIKLMQTYKKRKL